MPASVTLRRSKPSLAVAATEVFSPPLPPAAAAPLAVAEAPAPRAVAVLRVGDYEVGENPCPRLGGHPDIRY